MGGEVLVLGIVGMLTWLIPFFGLPIPIIGLVWGVLILRQKPASRWKAITGVALCSIGLFLSVGYSVISVIEPRTTTTYTLSITNGAPYVPPDTELVEWTADGVITEGEYDNKRSFGDNYELHWTSDGEYIYVGMQAYTTGWVAFGIQLNPRVEENVDMILGFVRGEETFIYDLFSVVPGLYARDVVLGGTSDISVFGGAEGIIGEELDTGEDEEGILATVIEFKRKLNTGDAYDQPLLDGYNTLVWAYGSEDGWDYPHVARGFEVIEL